MRPFQQSGGKRVQCPLRIRSDERPPRQLRRKLVWVLKNATFNVVSQTTASFLPFLFFFFNGDDGEGAEMKLSQLFVLSLAVTPSVVSAALFPEVSLVKMIDHKGFKQAMKQNVCV